MSIRCLITPHPVRVNIFNHANFAEPNAVVFTGSNVGPSAGVITGTATTSGQIQFALKVMF